MLTRLQAFIAKHSLLESGRSVAVGYSGGADSTCLLHLLYRAGYDVVAAHLHHGQRLEAGDEQERCEQFANSIGATFLSGHADVPAIATATKVGIEEAGRNARYEFFHQVNRRLGAKVATAHTADDNAESMLMNLARGSGMAGLAGIPIERDYVIRPLLWARKHETRRYCEENGLWFHDDPANEDSKFARVDIRSNVIPALERLNSKAVDSASRFADILREEDALLDAMAAAMLENSEIANEHPLQFLVADLEIVLSTGRLRHYPFAIVRRGIRLLAGALGAAADFEQAQKSADAIRLGEEVAITFEGGLAVVEIDAETVRARSLRRMPSYRQPLTIPGETISDEMRWSLVAWETSEEPARERASLTAVIDPGQAQGNLYVRPFEPGDRMQPYGAKSERKLQDLLTNSHVTSGMKAKLPIVHDMIGPIWIPAISIADRVKVTGAGRRLAMRLNPLGTREAV
ncbi:MAG: tRNA lysidine(34) synthetase TilS [Armatimonadetes bacterium]|nr:tRNA lysidine(34) synthetase TilS [Armatimonadota bacterium]